MSEAALPRILCVDDEPNLLAALERNLFGQFEVTTAGGGEAALAAMAEAPPFDVVVSDMRMPAMDGATFLGLVRQRSPDTVRVLLTGQADAESAIAAINRGAIFRFLCKPCPTEELAATLHEAVRVHRRILFERELLETTLAGAIRMLTEVLSMVAPGAFHRSELLQTCVAHVADRLGWADSWAVRVAAALSHVGCVGVPADLIQRDLAGGELSGEERRLLESHPEVGHRLLAEIPRLDTVARIVRYQAAPPPHGEPAEVVRGAQLLRAALYLVRCLSRKESQASAIEGVRMLEPEIPTDIVKALGGLRLRIHEGPRLARIRELMPGWRVERDIASTRGTMLLRQGSELSATAILALRNLHAAGAIEEPVLVSCGADPGAPEPDVAAF
ncbi:response regulator [Luteimonas sp. RD2P54]|uniref:Response regulator n=1 Tax=Luteimonas endophytica TaxID=3042023 RepID=A0ABT6J6X5_9GAMM|nr:response regulator [Luteimonas endophytica]MDH5822573.1 response regulator [Luteimonas endophytica]